ncbi:SDR family NAD(P)-dependent oxidoreductase [Salinimonas lutimaris]|uniref:SDR family NAD(P)-dependent oxidoreductase n=1 Tax=Salinimonas lutimaris TaxID=914153 RepID=UPI0010C09273|nr:SDR family NAD(P)-dependent oxidoreductase [Salinimonas lutimaris]
MTPIVFVSGGNRGIGLEMVRGFAQAGFKVLMGCRDEEAGEEVKKDIVGADIHVIEMDLSDDQNVKDQITQALAVYGRIDVLVNNAGVLDDGSWEELDIAKFKRSMQVHVNGPLTLIKEILPGMIERDYGRIINVTSGWGAFAEKMEGPVAYAVSKAALNALTLKLANDVGDDKNVKINAMCPGWVHTRMGGKDAPRTPEQGAATALWLGQLEKDGPTGQFFRDKEKINW